MSFYSSEITSGTIVSQTFRNAYGGKPPADKKTVKITKNKEKEGKWVGVAITIGKIQFYLIQFAFTMNI